MCDLPVPCQCTRDRRAEIRAEHIERSDALSELAYKLSNAGLITDAERDMLYDQSQDVWDDAIHIAASDDPLRSLCGQYGRNLADLPERPDSGSGCWTCLQKADLLEPKSAELAHA